MRILGGLSKLGSGNLITLEGNRTRNGPSLIITLFILAARSVPLFILYVLTVNL